MNIQGEIEKIIAKHKLIIADHPLIETIIWEINEIPYRELNSWRRLYNHKYVTDKNETYYINESPMFGTVMLFLQEWNIQQFSEGVEKIEIHLRSKKVEFKTHVEIIE